MTYKEAINQLVGCEQNGEATEYYASATNKSTMHRMQIYDIDIFSKEELLSPYIIYKDGKKVISLYDESGFYVNPTQEDIDGTGWENEY